MQIIDYETTLKELRHFQDVRLSRLQQIEMNIETITKAEMIDLYEMLQQTKAHIDELKKIINS